MNKSIQTYNINDKWIRIIGIPLIGILLPAFFNEYSFPTKNYIYKISISLLATYCILEGSRKIILFIVKKYPRYNNTFIHVLIEIPILFIYSIGIVLVSRLFLARLISDYTMENVLIGSIVFAILITTVIMSIYEGIYFFNRFKESFIRSEQLEKSTLEAKFQALKSQINPHFLFNSLNTLNTYVAGNDKATHFIHNLSDFLRYLLKNQEKELVELAEEIGIVKKYCFLQKSRYLDNLSVTFNIPEEFFKNVFVFPLSIQMLVENAIKHNIVSKDCNLKIDIYTDDEEYIVVKNNLQKKIVANSTHIGLKNIKDRYKYVTNKEVIILETDKFFKVSVPMLNVEKQ